MASRSDVAEIVEAIFVMPMHESPSDLPDKEEFCTTISDWLLRLSDYALDEGTMSSGTKSRVLEAIEGEAISEALDKELHTETDVDEVHTYLDVLIEMKALAETLHQNFPKTYPKVEEAAAFAMA